MFSRVDRAFSIGALTETRRAAEWQPGHLGIELEHESKQKRGGFVCTGNNLIYRCKALVMSGVRYHDTPLLPTEAFENAEPGCDSSRPHVLMFTDSILYIQKSQLCLCVSCLQFLSFSLKFLRKQW